jgi:hypothetical protein
MLSVTNKPFILSVTNKPFILSVVMLNVVMLSIITLSVVMLSIIMLSVVMLSVAMLNVVAPYRVKNLSGAPLLGILCLTHKHVTKLESLAKDKGSSLLRTLVNKYFTAEKSFKTLE